MPTQLHLPVQLAGAREINAVVAMVEREAQVAYFASGVPLFIHRADDPVGRRVAAGQMLELGLARQDELSAALRVNRTTLYRQHRKLQAARSRCRRRVVVDVWAGPPAAGGPRPRSALQRGDPPPPTLVGSWPRGSPGYCPCSGFLG